MEPLSTTKIATTSTTTTTTKTTTTTTKTKTTTTTTKTTTTTTTTIATKIVFCTILDLNIERDYKAKILNCLWALGSRLLHVNRSALKLIKEILHLNRNQIPDCVPPPPPHPRLASMKELDMDNKAKCR